MKLFALRRIGTAALVAVAAAVVMMPTSATAAPAPQSAQDQQAGDAALAEARAHMDAGRWESAANAYSEALRWLPGNEEAIRGLQEAETLMNRGDTIRDTERIAQVMREQARVEFDDAMSRSAELLAQEQFDRATQIALAAQIKLRQNRNLFAESEFASRIAQAEARLDEIDSAREIARLAKEEKAARDAKRARDQAAAAEERKIETEINERLRRVRQLQKAQKYTEALQVIDEILFFDELNPTALMLKDLLEGLEIYTRYAQIQKAKELSLSYNELESQERLILPRENRFGPGPRGTNELMQYPEDWPGLSIMRTGDPGYVDSPQDRNVSHVLNTKSIPVDFQANSFEQVISFLENVTGLNVYVDWKALDLIGVDREEEITLQLNEVPVGTALERVLEQLGDDTDRPQYAIQDGILTISSDEALRRRVTTLVYDIRDLLFEVPYFDNAPALDLDSSLSQGNSGGQGGGGSGGGGGGGFGGGGSGGGGGGSGGGSGGALFGDPEDESPGLSRAELVTQLVDIIQETVDPEGWFDNGGVTGTLQEYNGNLIITNTPRNHRLVEGLLSQLRDIRALQINIETRVLNVSTDWFEQIGVDLDVYFNTNNTMRQQQLAQDPLGNLADFFNTDGTLKDPLVFDGISGVNLQDPNNPQTPALPANTINYGQAFGVPDATAQNITYLTGPVGAPIRNTQGFTPIGVTQNSLDLLDLVAATTEFGSNILGATPALVTGFQFLDDVQVDLLIEATQADQRSVVLTAPRLTFFNGQRAWIAVTTQAAYVSGLQAVTGAAAGGFQPIVSTVSEGFVLDVEAVISSDRRYVTITVRFDQTELVGFEEVAFTGAAGGGGGGGFGGGNAANFEGTIQLPVLNGGFIRTTVSVPDKGTVLLGGARSVEEFETEVGVPVLSKIPFINRFFTNRLTSKDEQTLLILIRPEVIIQQENEDILFPGLSDTLGGAASYR